MNRLIPPLSVYLMITLMLQVSCKQEVKKNPEKIEKDFPSESVASEKSDKSRFFTTKSGKEIELKIQTKENGLFDFHVIPKGFEFTRDTLIISDSDPLSDGFLADLDNNGFEELYLITLSDGSGSYGMIYGFASNKDKSVSSIYLPPIHEDDLAAGAPYEGYMGHDSIYLDQGNLKRKFPIYLEGDPNCCPTGGFQLIEYKLIPGEANWILKGAVTNKGL